MENSFVAKIERFDMQGGWHYVPVPLALSKPLEYLAVHFGFIAVTAKVGRSSWATSLLPKGDGTHFIALPAKVRSKEKLSLGAEIEISFEARKKQGSRVGYHMARGMPPAEPRNNYINPQMSPAVSHANSWSNCRSGLTAESLI